MLGRSLPTDMYCTKDKATIPAAVAFVATRHFIFFMLFYHLARSKPKCNILWGKMWHGKKLQPIEY